MANLGLNLFRTSLKFKNIFELTKLNQVLPSSLRWYRPASTLAGQLNARIKATGPLTVADYMKEVLINPASGYYSQQESIGAQGDFVTSPEISQLFGEMIAIWILNEWQKVGSPKPMQIVELGPGKGTLMEDVLRVFGQLQQLQDVRVRLVELSERLKDAQARRLCTEVTTGGAAEGGETRLTGTSAVGCPVSWHAALSDVPRDCFTCVIAHEFFDALPVHKLQKTADGWREILIDIDPTKEAEQISLRYILSRHETPACKLFPAKEGDPRDHVEVSPDAGALMQQLAARFEEDGGFLLLTDYGHDGTAGDTFRGFKEHQLHDPLLDPGSADLTADVDFAFLRSCVENQALTFGPVTQRDFLTRLGIQYRLEMLTQSPSIPAETREKLTSGVTKLIDPAEMGERFKFFSMFPQVLEEHLKRFPVSGFS